MSIKKNNAHTHTHRLMMVNGLSIAPAGPSPSELWPPGECLVIWVEDEERSCWSNKTHPTNQRIDWELFLNQRPIRWDIHWCHGGIVWVWIVILPEHISSTVRVTASRYWTPPTAPCVQYTHPCPATPRPARPASQEPWSDRVGTLTANSTQVLRLTSIHFEKQPPNVVERLFSIRLRLREPSEWTGSKIWDCLCSLSHYIRWYVRMDIHTDLVLVFMFSLSTLDDRQTDR